LPSSKCIKNFNFKTCSVLTEPVRL